MSPGSALEASFRRISELVRRSIAASATSPFSHAPYPLAGSLDHTGDPGLLGPGSVSWEVIGDVAAFVGGIRGLLIQAAHPEVVAGVVDHSRYREDPLGRLSRTSAYVTATTYGSIPEVEHAVAQVRRVHRVVSGVSSRGRPYDASNPMLSAWVHNVLTDSFLIAHRTYGGRTLDASEEDRFVLEQTRVGALLGSEPMPATAVGLSRWIELHPDLARSPEMREAVDFLTDPPLDRALRAGYWILLEAAVATIPPRIRQILGIRRTPGAVTGGRSAVAGLRWALGYSPSWQLALLRSGEETPAGLFKQPLPIGIRSETRSG